MIALIDGDMLIYRAASAAQISVDLGDGLGDEPIFDEEKAAVNAARLVREWTKKAGCSKPLICLSAEKSDSFRHQIFKPYKANRTGEKPKAYRAAREAIEMEYETWSVPNLEADDLMGIAATSDRAQGVIVSGDKDMRTIPALVFNPMTDKKPVRIRPQVAHDAWMYQTMIGDTVDNYPGIPKVGEVTAWKILASPKRLLKSATGGKKPKTKWVEGGNASVWQSMIDHAARAGKDEEHVILMAQVARILQSGDYNEEARTVRLWRPNGWEILQLD